MVKVIESQAVRYGLVLGADLTDNIIHLVLARLPDAPPGVKKLFLVPKRLEDGSENGVSCQGLEHKMGTHASPTCFMNYDNAEGHLIGEAHQGLKCMFHMMNAARLAVGVQALGVAEIAQQKHWLLHRNDAN